MDNTTSRQFIPDIALFGRTSAGGHEYFACSTFKFKADTAAILKLIAKNPDVVTGVTAHLNTTKSGQPYISIKPLLKKGWTWNGKAAVPAS